MDYGDLINSWKLHLRVYVTPGTIRTYTAAVRGFLTWCESSGRAPALDRPTVNAFVVSLLDNGAQASTARTRQFGVKRFSAWLFSEGEIDQDLLAGIKPVALDEKVVPRLSEDQCRALVKACSGKGFRDRRDEALVRLMLETGSRAGEVVAMTQLDIDLKAGTAIIRRGKGGKGRMVPFGKETTLALDRYLRMRARHPRAQESALWLGDGGRKFNYPGLAKTLTWRASLAGIDGFHAHMLRHTMASRWLGAKGSEGGLMSVAGWKQRSMLDRYVKASAEDLAAEEAKRLNLGDL